MFVWYLLEWQQVTVCHTVESANKINAYWCRHTLLSITSERSQKNAYSSRHSKSVMANPRYLDMFWCLRECRVKKVRLYNMLCSLICNVYIKNYSDRCITCTYFGKSLENRCSFTFVKLLRTYIIQKKWNFAKMKFYNNQSYKSVHLHFDKTIQGGKK